MPTTPTDITHDDATAFVIAIPRKDGLGGASNFLRLGGPLDADESALPQDPASPTDRIDAVTQHSPFANGVLSYSTGSIQMLAPYGYIRLGMSSNYETWLPQEASQKIVPRPDRASRDALSADRGILLYSPDVVHTIAPTARTSSDEVTQYTSDAMTIVGDEQHLVSASRSWGGSGNPTVASFQHGNTYSAQLGSTTELMTGAINTQYLGNLTQVGLGGYLTTNYGATQSIYGGQVVAVSLGAVEVGGWGSAKLGNTITLAAVENATISCSPLAAGVAEIGPSLAAKAAMTAALMSVVTDASVGIAVTAGTSRRWSGLKSADQTMHDAIDKAAQEMIAVESLAVVLQALAIVAGVVTRADALAAAVTPTAGIQLTDGGLQLEALTDRIFMSGAGIYVTSPIINNGVVFTMFG